MNKDILDKVDEINNKIINSGLYQEYLSLKEKISNDLELMPLINEIKVLQKDCVHGLNKENELQEKIRLLNDNPIYREYLNVIDEINNTYNIIERTLNDFFDKKLN